MKKNITMSIILGSFLSSCSTERKLEVENNQNDIY